MPEASSDTYPPSHQALAAFSPQRGVDAKISGRVRVCLSIASLAMLAVLGLAFSLKPDPSGMGTHRQIPGFGPCTVQALFGFPCPACGMTTSWSLFTKGRIVAALMTSASGTILAAVCSATSIWFLIVSVRGKWPGLVPAPLPVAFAALGWILLVITEWLVRHWSAIFGAV